jgi:hypothetical protein
VIVDHLTDEQLSAYMDGAFKGRDAEEAGRHLAKCQPCSEALAELAAQDASLKPALSHDPGEAYFASFAGRVEQRIGAAGAARARGEGFDLGRFFRSPRALAWAGGVAVVVVGAGLALMTGREVIPPDLRDRDRSVQLERAVPGAKEQAPPAAIPPPTDDGVTSAPLAQDATPLTAAPARAFEVRRNEAGEEVPVRRLARAPAAPAPSAAPVTRSDEDARVRKKMLAEPLDAVKKSAPTQTLGATGAREESAAREYSFAPPPPARDLEVEAQLCGDVRDPEGRPVAGAQVALATLGRATTTDASGRFCLSAPRGEHSRSVMAVGYRESRQVVRVAGAEADARVTLAAVPVLDQQGGALAGRAAPGATKRALATEPIGPPATDRPVEARDVYSALSDTLRPAVREAQRLEADATARRSAAHFDFAAGAWVRVLARVMNGPLEIETRRHVAETRFRAWEIGPNSRRARAAMEALTSYLTRAPAGPERDQAVRWLDRVRP